MFFNEKNYPTCTMREASLLISDGPFGSNLKSEHYVSEGVRVIRLQNIGEGEFLDEDKAFISAEHFNELKKYTCRPGEIVIGTLGTPNFRAAIIPDYVPISINKSDCVHYIPNPDLLDSIFACAMFNSHSMLLQAENVAHGETRKRIAMGQVAQLRIILPQMRD